jgi:hypothetical protein
MARYRRIGGLEFFRHRNVCRTDPVISSRNSTKGEAACLLASPDAELSALPKPAR